MQMCMRVSACVCARVCMCECVRVRDCMDEDELRVVAFDKALCCP